MIRFQRIPEVSLHQTFNMTEELFTRIRDLLQTDHQASAVLIVRHAEGPIVFLIDEHHGLADLIRDSVSIARTPYSEFRRGHDRC
jgi:hypothetical protein